MITLPEASIQFPSLVACADNLEQLYIDHKSCKEVRSAKLVAALGALLTPSINNMMSERAWPLDLLASSVLDSGQFWSFSQGGVEECALEPQHFSLIKKAAGLEGAPDGNLRFTWSIRRYLDKSDWLGSLPWLKTLVERNSTQTGMFIELLQRLVQLFEISQAAGADFFIEQMTVILAKDQAAPNPCLTPRLHADEYYGYRQTAIASLIEKDWSIDGGTWFLPAITMQDISDGDQITPECIYERFPKTPIVATGNGDLCIYDGMRNAAGEVSSELGAAHISGDIPGRSARLLILMHHRPVTMAR